MPTRLARLAAASLPSLLLSGCLLGLDAPEESGTTRAKRNDVITASVGGSTWEAKGDATTFASVDIAAYAIGGFSSTTSLTLRLVGVGRPGTYPIGGSVPPYATVRYVGANGTFGNVSALPIGTLTITEITPERIGGTFAFTAPREDRSAGTVVVTGGSFSIAVIPAYSIPIQP
jgi:hypothetical protein